MSGGQTPGHVAKGQAAAWLARSRGPRTCPGLWPLDLPENDTVNFSIFITHSRDQMAAGWGARL